MLIFSKVLPPFQTSAAGGVTVYPDPAISYVNLQLPEAGKYTSAALLDNIGRLLVSRSLPATAGITRFDLPARLPAGVYFIRLTGEGTEPLLFRVLKVQ